MSAVAAGKDTLVIGGRPTVDLLPPEVRAQRASKALRRWLGIGLVLLLVLVGLVIGLATVNSLTAVLGVSTAQARTAELLAQQAKYGEARSVQQSIATGEEAQRVAASTEVDWAGFIALAVATLPAEVQFSEVAVESATPMIPYAQSADPLQGPRVATVTFTAVSATFVPSAAVLDGLVTVPGYVDAQASPVEPGEDETGYKTTIVLHIDEGAYANRFAPKEGE